MFARGTCRRGRVVFGGVAVGGSSVSVEKRANITCGQRWQGVSVSVTESKQKVVDCASLRGAVRHRAFGVHALAIIPASRTCDLAAVLPILGLVKHASMSMDSST